MTIRSTSTVAIMLAAALLVLAVALRSSPVSACACCGGHSENVPIGWSASGNSLLVERTTYALCEVSVALEVWRRAQGEPAACFDLQRAPDRAVACDAISRQETRQTRPSERAALYPREARVLRNDRVRVTAPPARGTRVATVEVRAASGWRPVWSGDVHFPGPGYDGGGASFDIWPSPTSTAALLRIQSLDPTRRGHDSPFHDVRMVWITLPDGVSAYTLSQRDPRRPDTLEDPRRRPLYLGEVGEASLW